MYIYTFLNSIYLESMLLRECLQYLHMAIPFVCLCQAKKPITVFMIDLQTLNLVDIHNITVSNMGWVAPGPISLSWCVRPKMFVYCVFR